MDSELVMPPLVFVALLAMSLTLVVLTFIRGVRP
jgi:hypothetical protein